MRVFRHTAKEPGLWRGWLKNGQSVELSWGKRGWSFGGGVHVHCNDADAGERMLFLKVWRATVVLPLGITQHPWPPMEGPEWSAYASKEFGLTFNWGMMRKSYDWPWDWHTLAYEAQMADGTWGKVKWDDHDQAYTEAHPYTYKLRSGEVQHRTATLTKRRHVITWRVLRRIGWPYWIKESIDIEFDGEVGEGAGSWKGGCIGCGYELQPGETMLEALRRMEREREFN